ncbi:Uncharacterised protein [uncultured archaeon]|nr:Uncharacterised protein [uncultured archaeon]
MLIVFGAEERAKVEAIRDRLSEQTQKEYDNATTYHDGKWVHLTVDNDTVVNDVKRLLAVKRRPKNSNEA